MVPIIIIIYTERILYWEYTEDNSKMNPMVPTMSTCFRPPFPLDGKPNTPPLRLGCRHGLLFKYLFHIKPLLVQFQALIQSLVMTAFVILTKKWSLGCTSTDPDWTWATRIVPMSTLVYLIWYVLYVIIGIMFRDEQILRLKLELSTAPSTQANPHRHFYHF